MNKNGDGGGGGDGDENRAERKKKVYFGDCPICLEEMTLEDEKECAASVRLDCGHLFHSDCISAWWKKVERDLECPYCRQKNSPNEDKLELDATLIKVGQTRHRVGISTDAASIVGRLRKFFTKNTYMQTAHRTTYIASLAWSDPPSKETADLILGRMENLCRRGFFERFQNRYFYSP